MPGKQQLKPGSSEALPSVIGIISNIEGYRLAHFLNKHLGVAFKRLPDLEVHPRNDISFELYYYRESHLGYHWFLLANKDSGNFLISTLRHFDFWLICHHLPPGMTASDIAQKIKEIKLVQLASLLPAQHMYHWETLIEEIELHLIEKKIKDEQKE